LELLPHALPIFWAGMLMQLILLCSYVGFPLGSRSPPRCHRLWSRDFAIDSLLGGNLDQFSTLLSRLALHTGTPPQRHFERIVRVNLKQTRATIMWKQLALEAFRKANSPGSCENAFDSSDYYLGLTFASLLGGAVHRSDVSPPGLANRLYETISLRDYLRCKGIMVFFLDRL